MSLDMQGKMGRDAPRFAEDLRVLDGGRIRVKLWSLSRGQPLWVAAVLPDWLPIDKARAAARSGRLVARPRHRQWLLGLDASRW